MAIVLEDSVGYSTASAGATHTTGDVTTAGSNRAIVVGVVFNNNEREVTPVGMDITSVKFDPGGGNEISLSAVSGTKTADDGVGATAYDDGVCELFAVANPANSVTAGVEVVIEKTTLADDGFFIFVWVFSGVDQTTPCNNGTANKSEAGSSNPAVTVTSATDDLALGIGFFEGHGNTVTHGAGPTSRYNINLGGTSDDNGWFWDWTGAASRAFSWTASISDKWAASGCNVQEASASATYTQHSFRVYKDAI